MNPEKFERLAHERNPMTRPGPATYNGPSISKPPVHECIEQACSDLHERLDILNEQVNILSNRLSPILKPENPCCPADVADKNNNISTMRESIMAATAKVKHLDHTIETLMGRIDS